MKNETVTIKKSDLREFLNTVSSITQKTAEAEGTLKMIDDALDDVKGVSESDTVWALRNAYRNIESAINDAGDLYDAIDAVMLEKES